MSPGAWIWSKEYREAVQIVQAQTLWGKELYRVWVPSRNMVVQSYCDQFLPVEESEPSTKERLLYIVAAVRVADTLSQEIFVSPLNSNVIPLPHQLYVLSQALSTDKIRYLLADEVGLGKTVEAGLILKELKLRNLAKRILVVAPKSLVEQWVQEMQNHFNEDFKLVIPESAFKLLSNKDIWNLFNQIVVPLDSVKPVTKRRGWSKREVAVYNRERFEDLVSAGWDLIIVDEAHKLAGTTTSVARYKLGKALAKASPYLLLLSATPHQGKTDAFLRLMSLLDRNTFNFATSIERETVTQYVIRTEKRKAIDPEGNSLFTPRYTETVSVEWEEKHQLQQELYEKITEYVRNGYNRAIKEKKRYIGFVMVLMQRLVSSSTRAIRTALEKRLSVLEGGAYYARAVEPDEEWWEMDTQERMEDLFSRVIPAFTNEHDEVQHLVSLARKCEAMRTDVKAEVLIELIYNLQREENNPGLKILVFTQFLPTQDMLKEFLETRGFSVVCLNGVMSIKERRNAQLQFADKASVMISTEAGGEGLNLQFCHIVINYDIPWNPMRLEQRIGRVDRIGQVNPVKAFNFVFHNTVEERVHEVLEEKLVVILRDLGFDKVGDVLDSGDAEKGFEDLYRDAIMDPEKAEERITRFIESFRDTAENERKNLNILETDYVLNPEKARALSSHPLFSWIEKMVVNYLMSEGGVVGKGLKGYNLVWPDGYTVRDVVFTSRDVEKMGANFMLEDPRIQEIVECIPRFVPGQPVVHVKIKGLQKEIQGYWCLWRVAVGNAINHIRAFPQFLHVDGRFLLPTANKIWDSLIRGDFEIVNVNPEDSAAYNIMEEHAHDRGQSIFLELEGKERLPEFYPVLFIYVEGDHE
ncbi:MAG: DEAD/DEAH box helicase family protein [Theionarchaea archaeon]|nr:DEAD/DEAH box helicase family protein [Theionarchaea archaeon]